MPFKKLKNTELVALCAQRPEDRNAWLEFCHRFDDWIWLVVSRECKMRAIFSQDAQYRKTLQDLVQEVYLKLVSHECKALKNFIGASEKSIYTYLNIIAKNVVKNHAARIRALKRPLIEKSLDAAAFGGEDEEKIAFINGIRSMDFDVEQKVTINIFKEEVETLLNKILDGKNKQRNMLMVKLHLFEGFSAEEIASQFPFGLSVKRISNLITEIKRRLRQEMIEQRMEIF